MPKGKYGIIDRDGNWLLEPCFDVAISTVRGPIAVKRGKKWGYIDREGKTVVEPTLDEVGPFAGELGPVRKGKKWGYVDAVGTQVVPASYDTARAFSNGLGEVAKKGKWGLIDTTGELRIPLKYDGVAPYADGRVVVNVGGKEINGLITIGGKWGIVDGEGNKVLAPKYDSLTGFCCGVAIASKGSKHAYVDVSGKEVWKAPSGGFPGLFSEDRAWVIQGDGPTRCRLLSRDWQWLTEPRFAEGGLFSQGLCPVNEGGSVRQGELIGGKWGYVDLEGSVVVEPQYDEAFTHMFGLAGVKTKGKWGLVDREGALVVPTQYRDIFALSPDAFMAMK